MKTVPVSLNELKVQGITIGRRDTYGTEQVVFDLAELIDVYGEGSAVLMVKRPGDETAYPATTEQTDGQLIWTVSDIDTAYKGKGECEIFWYVNGNLAKTVIYPTNVLRDIGETTEEPPDAYPTWVDHLTELGAETLENARKAAKSAEEADLAAEDAGKAADDAEKAADKSERQAGIAEDKAAESKHSSKLAESWAVGGTGERTGEDTNNAKFWSGMAQQAAGKDGWVHFYIDEDGHLHYVKTENAALRFYIDAVGHLHVTNA